MKISFTGEYADVLVEMTEFLADAKQGAVVVPASRDTAEAEMDTVAEAVDAEPEPKKAPAKKSAKPSKRKGPPKGLSREVCDQPLDENGNKPAQEAPAETSDITNADLAKAASHAAGQITPARVKETLEHFGVSKVQELVGDQRQEFLDDLKAQQ